MKPARQRGFTLLEVLVATAILGVAVVTLLGLHARNLDLSAEASDLTIAGTLASDVVAATRLQSIVDLGVVHGKFAAKETDADGQQTIYGGPASDRFVWTREVTTTALVSLQQIKVRIQLAGDDRVLAEFWTARSVKIEAAP